MATIIADRHSRPRAHAAAANEAGVVEQTGQADALFEAPPDRQHPPAQSRTPAVKLWS
jgi:hypothetical protein